MDSLYRDRDERKETGTRLGEMATGTWDKLEKVFEDRVGSALHALNVPTRKDIDGLSSPRHVARSVRISRTTRPICFMPRLMEPILLGRLSALPNPSFPGQGPFAPEHTNVLTQKRRSSSAFTLTYILRLRSCKSMDAFVISSLPPLRRRRCKWQGPFAPRTLLRFIATADPAATLSSSADFPVSPVIRPTLLRRFLAGTRRASPVARHVLVTVLSLPPRRSVGAASIRFRLPMLPFALRLGARPSGLLTFEATFAFTVVTAR